MTDCEEQVICWVSKHTSFHRHWTSLHNSHIHSSANPEQPSRHWETRTPWETDRWGVLSQWQPSGVGGGEGGREGGRGLVIAAMVGIVAIQWVTTDFYKNIQRYTSLPIKLTILVLGLASRQLLFLSEHHDLDLHTKCDLVAGIRDTNKGSNKHVKHSPLPRRPYKLHNTVCASFTAISDLALFPGWMPWQLLWVQTVTSAARK